MSTSKPSATAATAKLAHKTHNYPPIIRKFASVTTLLLTSTAIYYTTHSNLLAQAPTLIITYTQWRAQFKPEKRRVVGLIRLLIFVGSIIGWHIVVLTTCIKLYNYLTQSTVDATPFIYIMPYVMLYVSYVSNTQTMYYNGVRAWLMHLLYDIPAFSIVYLFKLINWPINSLSSTIVPGKCCLGCMPLAADIKTLATQKDKVSGIVNLCAEFSGARKEQHQYHIDQLWLPTIDSSCVNYSDICKAVDYMNSMNAQGKCVFVHCKAGMARSATVVLCYLVNNGMTAKAALALMQTQRPEVAASILRYDAVHQYIEYCDNNNVNTPIVLNSWPFTGATKAAYQTLLDTDSAIDAVVAGCTASEQARDDHTVGPGGSVDEQGESTQDAMVMDGTTMRVGAVANLRNIEPVTQVALEVMKRTRHSMIVGSLATDFAIKCGFKQTDLHSEFSRKQYADWLAAGKQPNYWLSDKPTRQPKIAVSVAQQELAKKYNEKSHDTIGCLAMNSARQMAAACSSNGAAYKIPGRVGDSPICGSGSYVDDEVGAASATGAGDIMLRFCPSYQCVENMRAGMTCTDAAVDAMKRIMKHFPDFQGAVVCMNNRGQHGAASYGWTFSYTVQDRNGLKILDVPSL